MSEPRPETPYAETEALLAVLHSDPDALRRILTGMTDAELAELLNASHLLQAAVSDAFRHRHTAPSGPGPVGG